MNTTRTVFGKHKAGYIFPLLLNVRSTDTCFAGLLQRLHTSDQFILFWSQSLRVIEGTQESLELMGVRLYVCVCVYVRV